MGERWSWKRKRRRWGRPVATIVVVGALATSCAPQTGPASAKDGSADAPIAAAAPTSSGPERSGHSTYSAANPDPPSPANPSEWLTNPQQYRQRLDELREEPSLCILLRTLTTAFASLKAFPESKPAFLAALHHASTLASGGDADALRTMTDWIAGPATDPAPASVVAAWGTLQQRVVAPCS